MKGTKIIIPRYQDYFMNVAVTNEIRRRWDENLFIAKRAQEGQFPFTFETYWDEAIDTLADIKLQLINQE